MSAKGERAAVVGERAAVVGERAAVIGEGTFATEPCAMLPAPDARTPMRMDG